MKYFFSDNCYWDSEKEQVFKDDALAKLTGSQTRILSMLIANNGNRVPREELYWAMKGVGPDEKKQLSGDWKGELRNKFTRHKNNEIGIFFRVSEIERFVDIPRSHDAGYMISIPEENIIDPNAHQKISWEEYRNIWQSKKDWEKEQRDAHKPNNNIAWLATRARRYVQGDRCIWPLVFDSSQYTPVKRDVVTEMLKEIDAGYDIIALTGAGGEGKTTALMQLCVELYRAGKNVLYHWDSDGKYDFPDNLCDVIFLVDAPAASKKFTNFLMKAAREGLTVVVASRSNEWVVLQEMLSDDMRRSIKEIELKKISTSEAKGFARYLKEHAHWITRNNKELVSLFLNDSYGFLYASMLLAVNNADSLERTAERIIDAISKFENGEIVLRILGTIVFAEQAGSPIRKYDFSAFCKKCEWDARVVNSNLRKEVVLNGGKYQTRHDTISRLFYKTLFLDNEKWSLLDEEREYLITDVLDFFLYQVTNIKTDLRPTDLRAIELANMLVNAFEIVHYEEAQAYIIQRLLEDCQQHGHAIIDRFYHHVNNDDIKDDLAARCFERRLPLWDVYRHWLQNLISKEESFDAVNSYCETLCLEMDAPINIWDLWVGLYEKNSQDNSESINKAREIYKRGLNALAGNAHWWIAWASFEEHHDNLGDINVEFSARWILREGSSCAQDNPHLWLKWVDVEENCENLGDPETKYSARWIAKEGCEKAKDANLWLKRVYLEERAGNIGDISLPDSARGLLYIGSAEFPQSTHLWERWAKTETRMNNIGDYETPNSAAWIFKEACTNHGVVSNVSIWMKWADFAANYNDSMQCSYADEFTPSMILKRACVEHKVSGPEIWIRWADTEEAVGNIGNYNIPYSSAWLHKEVSMRFFDEYNHRFYAWACFLARNKDNTDLFSDYTLDSILKDKCLTGTIDAYPWIAWAVMEEARGNVGDYATTYSAAWLYQEGCIKHNPKQTAICWLNWAKFAHSHPLANEHGDFINAEYVLQLAQRECAAAFNNHLWTDLANFKQEIGYQ